MMQNQIGRLYLDMCGLTVLRGVLKDPALNRFMAVLEMAAMASLAFMDSGENPGTQRSARSSDAAARIGAYSDFLAELYQKDTDLGRWLLELVLADENPYVLKRAKGQLLSQVMVQALLRDLEVLERLAAVDSKGLKDILQIGDWTGGHGMGTGGHGMGNGGHGMETGGLANASVGWNGPDCTWGQVQIRAEYERFLNMLPTQGYGIWASHYAFYLQNGPIGTQASFGASTLAPVPVAHPDALPLSRFFGYERERQLIRQNVEAFVMGKTWQNMLLYGDAGTGKSSTIKSFAREYAGKGLRIIEVSKHQLGQLPQIIESLADNPLKFILFIDDLTFSRVDDDFTALKTTLEGGLLSQGENVAIFATTNRRHLVKETLSERAGEQLHVNDGLQETMGLAGRFGLTVIFERPPMLEYLHIVESMAIEKGIKMPLDELTQKAEAFAIRQNGRSPRVAKQFIDSILMQQPPLPPARS